MEQLRVQLARKMLETNPNFNQFLGLGVAIADQILNCIVEPMTTFFCKYYSNPEKIFFL